MIASTFEEAHSPDWIEQNIHPTHELVILRQVIPWLRIIGRLTPFYDSARGRFGKQLRTMVALLILSRLRDLSDREVVSQVKENRYMQYFCNVSDKDLQTFLHPGSMSKFRKRLDEDGTGIIEMAVFEKLRRSGVVDKETSLIDSSVLENNIIYPNDVRLLFKAFVKMESFAKRHHLPLWWDQKEIKKRWRAFGLAKAGERVAYLLEFHFLFVPTLETFSEKVNALQGSEKEKQQAYYLLDILSLLECQTRRKLAGEEHIKDRIVSLDEIDARPIKRGKSYPRCEFGTTLQMSFNRQGFMITAENFIGNPNDKTLYGNTLELFRERMKGDPETVVTDMGCRSRNNFEITPEAVTNVFLGKSEDVAEEMCDFCRRARSATEGFIAVAKNLRGLRCSLYRGLSGDRIWTLLCQTAHNLKKLVQLYLSEKLEEKVLVKLGLLA